MKNDNVDNLFVKELQTILLILKFYIYTGPQGPLNWTKNGPQLTLSNVSQYYEWMNLLMSGGSHPHDLELNISCGRVP